MKSKLILFGFVFILFSCGKSKKELEAEKNYHEVMDALQNMPKYEERIEVCPDCRGTGKNKCNNCKGSGKIEIRNIISETKFVDCDSCNGFGFFVCKKCGGNGEIKVQLIQ